MKKLVHIVKIRGGFVTQFIEDGSLSDELVSTNLKEVVDEMKNFFEEK